LIIDSHVHLYPDKIAAKASQAIGAFYDLPMVSAGSAVALQQACRTAGVEKCVLCSVATAPAQVPSINRFLADEKDRLGYAALCALHPHMTADELSAALDDAQARGMAGSNQNPDIPRFDADYPSVFFLYEALSERKLTLLIHAGDTRYKYSNPERIAHVLQAFPQLTVVAAHFGGWSEWDDSLLAFASGYG
jgi:predicted TIM-barrel fold metal-dependent hydrolase